MTSVIERKLRGFPGVTEVQSFSEEGRSLLRVELDRRQNSALFLVRISDHLTTLNSELPQGVVLHFEQNIPEELLDMQGFMILRLSGRASPDSLRRLALEVVSPQLLSVRKVAGLRVEGGFQRELLVRLEPDRLEAHDLPGEAVRRELGDALSTRSHGRLHGRGRSALEIRSGLVSLAAVERLPVRGREADQVLRLREVAQTGLAPTPPWSVSRIDSQPVVSMILERAPDSHLLHLSNEVHQKLEELRRDLPKDVLLEVAEDRSESARKELRDLAWRGGGGFLLVLWMLALFLSRSQAVKPVLFSAALSLCVALGLMAPLGLSFNLVTMAGLALVTGLLVDNGVVVVVQLSRCRTHGAAALSRELGKVSLPLVGGTATTLAVLIPFVYLSGELRALFSSFALLLALTLTFALASALVLIPLWMEPSPGRHVLAKPARSLQAVLELPYRSAAQHPRATVCLMLLMLGLPTPWLPEKLEEPPEGWPSEKEHRFAERYNATLGGDPFRKARLWLDPLLGGFTRPFLQHVELGKRWDFDERPELRVWIQLPPGSGIERTDECIRPFEQEARTSPTVERTLVNVRNRVAILRVLFHEDAMESDQPYLLRKRLIARALQIAGMEVSISGLVPLGFYSGLGEVSGFTVHAFGPGYDKLEEVAKNFSRRVERDPRVADVDINAAGYGQPPAREIIRFHWGPEAAARTGLSARELAEALRPRLWREAPDFYANFEGDPRMPVRIVMQGAEDLDLGTLLGTPVAANLGDRVRLADHAELSIEKDPSVIERIDQQYHRTLRVFYRGPSDMAKEMLDKEIAWMKLPAGYRLERSKPEFFTEEVKKEFFWLVLGTIALVFLVIAAVLESWPLAAIAMLAVPLSWIGIALGFLVTGQNFAEGAFLGMLLVIGIAVNNLILLVDGYRRLRQARPDAPASRLALLALRQRLRPMWTTTFTSIAGMLPLLVIPDAGNLWVGLAVTVVGGLLASTLLAPAATLAALSWAYRVKARTAARRLALP